VLFSFLFSPSRGLIFRQLRFRKNRRDLELKKTLYFMYNIAKDHEEISHPHEIKILNNFHGFTKGTLMQLVDKNWVTLDGTMWAITAKGFKEAQNLYSQNT
jgi:manganese/zinc/iron transport system permease protein